VTGVQTCALPIYRILSKLLDYPDDGLAGVLWEVRLRARSGEEFESHERPVIEQFVEYLESLPLTEAQAAYVMTFDMAPEHSLHLTHHLFGDDKNRGPALIDLTEFYKEYGLELSENELPDFLPLILEFADQLDPDEARLFLSQWSKVLRQLAANLEEAGSPYAALIRLVEDRARIVKAAA
jgi:nitrate reductase delta subunit